MVIISYITSNVRYHRRDRSDFVGFAVTLIRRGSRAELTRNSTHSLFATRLFSSPVRWCETEDRRTVRVRIGNYSKKKVDGRRVGLFSQRRRARDRGRFCSGTRPSTPTDVVKPSPCWQSARDFLLHARLIASD